MATKRALSIEDGNLETSILGSRDRQYTDVDLTLEPKPVTGDVYTKHDAAAVKQAVKTILLTGNLERPFSPDFGAGLYDMLFELIESNNRDLINDRIESAIRRFEPRAEIFNIKIDQIEDDNRINVEVTFRIKNTQELITFNTIVKRLR